MSTRRLKRFLHRHNRWLSVIGAFTVFLTFIVKDVLREQLKDTKDAIASTQNLLILRDDIHEIWLRLATVPHQRSPFISEDTPIEEILSAIQFPQSLKTTVWFQLQKFDFERISQMARIVPEEKEMELRLQSLKSENQQLLKSADELVFSFLKHVPAQGGEPVLSIKEKQELGDQFVEFDSQRMALWTKTAEFSRQLLQRAEQVHDRSERRYRIFTILSYFLYAFGWIIALIGKLSGVEGGSSE